MQHNSGCTAMYCTRCRATFCLYCRTTFVDTKALKASDACHNHIWDCGKKPLRSATCTDSVLFPANDTDTDFIACLQNCHKLTVLKHIVCSSNWSALEIKRLVLNVTFQGFLVHLKERQTHYRSKYPDKPDLLRMCFIKTIGIREDFDFDVSSHCPDWADDCTEDETLRMKLRSEAKIQERKIAAASAAGKRAANIAHLVSMGFEAVQASVALEATLGNLDAAIAMLVD